MTPEPKPIQQPYGDTVTTHDELLARLDELRRRFRRIGATVDAKVIDDAAAAIREQANENMCDSCGGTGKPVSNLPCMCGGTGKMSDAARNLREQLFDEHKAREEAERRLINLQSEHWKERHGAEVERAEAAEANLAVVDKAVQDCAEALQEAERNSSFFHDECERLNKRAEAAEANLANVFEDTREQCVSICRELNDQSEVGDYFDMAIASMRAIKPTAAAQELPVSDQSPGRDAPATSMGPEIQQPAPAAATFHCEIHGDKWCGCPAPIAEVVRPLICDGSRYIIEPAAAPSIDQRETYDLMPTHTDHPARHWDRTCPACNPAPDEQAGEMAVRLATEAERDEALILHGMEIAAELVQYFAYNPAGIIRAEIARMKAG